MCYYPFVPTRFVDAAEFDGQLATAKQRLKRRVGLLVRQIDDMRNPSGTDTRMEDFYDVVPHASMNTLTPSGASSWRAPFHPD
jgi:hypothetical protein